MTIVIERVFLERDRVDWVATEGSILVPATRCVCITLGIRLRSQRSRTSNNWRPAYGRAKQMRTRVANALSLVSLEHVKAHLRGPATRIVFVRLARRTLDTDNLAIAFKPIRDQTCAWLRGTNETWARADDGLRSGFTFDYRQQQQRPWGVRIELWPDKP